MTNLPALYLRDIETCKAIGKLTNDKSDPLYYLPERLWDEPLLRVLKTGNTDVMVKDPRPVSNISWHVPYCFVKGFMEVKA